MLAIGHSTRPASELIEWLAAVGVTTLADVRTIPRSRANPQFEGPALARVLDRAGIGYVHLPRLGGLRRPRKGSEENAGWRNASFRGYADHMATKEFTDALESLLVLARRKTTAIMCAEAVPWRCHRTLVADALKQKRCRVLDIIGDTTPRAHKYTPFLKIKKGALTYPPGASA